MLTESVLTAKQSFHSRVSLISKGLTKKMMESRIINWMRRMRRSRRTRLREGNWMKKWSHRRELCFQASKVMRVLLILTSSSRTTRLSMIASIIKVIWTREWNPAKISETTFHTHFYYVLRRPERGVTFIRFLEWWIYKSMMCLTLRLHLSFVKRSV